MFWVTLILFELYETKAIQITYSFIPYLRRVLT